MSPAMEMRADSQNYNRAARILRNWVVTPQGGITLRHGSKYIGIPKANQAFRLFPFRRGGDESDILFEMTGGAVRLWVDDALINQPGTSNPVELENPYTEEEIATVQFANQEETAVSAHQQHPPYYYIARGNNFERIVFPRDEIPSRRFNDVKSTINLPSTSTYRIEFIGSWQNGNQFTFAYDNRENSRFSSPVYGGYYGGRLARSEFEDFESLPKVYFFRSQESEMVTELQKCIDENPILRGRATATNIAGNNVFQIEITNNAVAGRNMEFFPRVSGLSVDVTGTGVTEATLGAEPAWSYPFRVLHNGNYYRAIQAHLSSATNEPGTGASWQDFWENEGPLSGGTPAEQRILAEFDYMFPSGSSWATATMYGVWDRGFPRSLTFHQQRLYYANTQDLPSTVWGSRIGDYLEFSPGPNDADPVEFTLASQGTPAIQWMTSLNGLFMGTTAGDWRISADVTITPSSINAQKQNNSRSALQQPITINNQVFYTMLGGQKVKASQYVRDALTALSEDVTIAVEHLFRPRVIDLALMQIPDTMVTAVRSDGEILGLSYNPETDVAAWYEWATTQGQFLDVASVFDNRAQQEAFYVAVVRDGTYMIERIPYPPDELVARPNLQGLVYFDSYQEGTVVNSTQITGIDQRFREKTVGLTVNDAWEGEFRVTSAGTITLTRVVNGYWSLGFRYKGECVTFERVGGNPQGEAFGTARRWNKLYVRLVNSALPLINGQRAPDRTPSSPMNLPEPLRTQDIRLHNLGFNDGTVVIEQDLPFPTHIVGLYGQIGVNDA